MTEYEVEHMLRVLVDRMERMTDIHIETVKVLEQMTKRILELEKKID